MKALYISLRIDLPEDPFSASAIYHKLQPSWATLLTALDESGTHYDLVFSERERRVRRKKKSKPQLVPPPPEAA